jgi:hypothetical protein
LAYDPNDLRAVFVCFVKLFESQHRQIAELVQQVASLQGTVRGLDPTFDDVLEAKKAEIASVVEQFGPPQDDQFAQLYELVEKKLVL